MRIVRAVVDRVDAAVARFSGRRRVLIDARTPMNFAILGPVVERLRRDPRVELFYSSDRPADIAEAAAAAGVRARVHPRPAMIWRRIDLALSSDPWDPIPLRRCRRRANFFHGMAGKYDLDAPSSLPIGFDIYDGVAFVNADRMRRYIGAGIVRPEAAVLVGYPKVDALVNGRYDAAAIHARLQLEMHRPTAIYAPTWSPASSLHVAGEAIVNSLVDAGFNVIVKLHDRSLDLSQERYSGGIDWRARFAQLHRPGRIAFVESADSSPLLAASDVMVTDHSSIGYEFCLLDRPLIVFDAPDLARVARINPEKIAQLRGAARVVTSADAIGPAALDELDHRDRLADARRAIVREMFHEPGTATERALDMVYTLLNLVTWGSASHPGSVACGAGHSARGIDDGASCPFPAPLPRRRAVRAWRQIDPSTELDAEVRLSRPLTMKFSVLIATYNRAAVLEDTLASLACLRPDAPWEVIVIDNNSPDNTRQVVEQAMPRFPVPLRYAFEREQGRSAALNCGFRLAQGEIIVTTDDDVRVEPDWLNRIEAGLAAQQCDYVGGRVFPLWGGTPPRWLPQTNSRLWAVIALLDYGPDPIRLGRRAALGVNMAMRREAIDRVGGFDAKIGRKAGTLLGQEVREWCLRAKSAGLVGYYIPDVVVQHLIPADRLTKKYFRRWFFWRGISRAMLYRQTGLDMESPETSSLDFRTVPHLFGIPRYLFRSALVALRDAIVATLKNDPVNAFEHELWLWMFAGIVKQRWQDRREPIAGQPARSRQPNAESRPINGLQP